MRILRQSTGVIHRMGYYGTSVSDISQAAGIPKGSVYNYFEGKEDFAAAVLEMYFENLKAGAMQVLSDTSLKPRRRIIEFYHRLVQSFLSENRVDRGCLIGNMSQEMGAISSPLALKADEMHRSIASAIRSNLESAVEDNQWSPPLAPSMLADFIVSAWQGTLLRSKVDPGATLIKTFPQTIEQLLYGGTDVTD